MNTSSSIEVQLQTIVESPTLDPLGTFLIFGGVLAVAITQTYARKRGVYVDHPVPFQNVEVPLPQPVKPEPEAWTAPKFVASASPPSPPSPPPAPLSPPAPLPIPSLVAEDFDFLNILRTESSIACYSEMQGAGKSTILQWVMYDRLAKGFQVVVLDSHLEYGKYPSTVQAFGKSDLEDGIRTINAEIDRRYEVRATTPGPWEFTPLMIICDEVTDWGASVDKKLMADFQATWIAASRKANAGVLIVTHSWTVAGLGGVPGRFDAVSQAFVKIRPTSVACPSLDNPNQRVPSGKADFIDREGNKQEGLPFPADALHQSVLNQQAQAQAQVKLDDRIDPRDWKNLDEQTQDLILDQIYLAIRSGEGKEATLTAIFNCARGGNDKWKKASDIWDYCNAEINAQKKDDLIARIEQLM
ncbi:MAG: hypothetical protein ACO3YX_06420 [Candidatus Nanopelagicaceae bacterium]